MTTQPVQNRSPSATLGVRRTAAARPWRPAIWIVVLAIAVALLVPFRARLDKSHVTLALLLVVLTAAADGGRRTGLTTAALAFLAFNWFFLPPYGTLVVSDPLDWFVLFAFLGTSAVASHLFHRVQREADEARERTAEVSTLASLGADAMSAPRSEGALQIVAETVRTTLGVHACRVYVARGDVTLQEWASAPASSREDSGAFASDVGSVCAPPEAAPAEAEPVRLALSRGARVAVLESGIVRVLSDNGASLHASLRGEVVRRLLIPLRGGARVIGVLDIADGAGIPLPEPRERLVEALAYYAALGAERARRERADEHLEAMREAERMRNAVIASVSHDLRTPLTTIRALAHQLGSLGDERSEIIAQEADRLNSFVSDMLDVSRLASGHFPLRIAIAPVEELISAALQQVEGAYGMRHIAVHLPAGDHFPLAHFDLTHSVRILVNLLENVRKYAPDDSPVDVEVEVVDGGARTLVRVADRGPGVALEEAERIFDALYRPTSSRPDVGSAGLGLAIARGLAEAQGGSLVYAPRAGGGSVFTLTLRSASLTDIDHDERSSR